LIFVKGYFSLSKHRYFIIIVGPYWIIEAAPFALTGKGGEILSAALYQEIALLPWRKATPSFFLVAHKFAFQ